MNRVWTIVDKEWSEVFKNRIVLFTVAFMPLLFTVLPLVMLYSMRGLASSGDVADVPRQFLQTCGDLSAGACFQYYLLNEFLLLFMMMPLIIPISIAAYSVVGEKTTRSLEPLLATPISTAELLTGKSVAAVVPAVLASWAAFIIFILLAPLVGALPGLVGRVFGPVWLLAIFVAGPLMAIVAVNVALIVSSRASDPRVAEQIAAVIVVPLLGLIFGQLAGVIIINVALMLSAISVLLLAAAGLTYLGVRLFQREQILTQWK